MTRFELILPVPNKNLQISKWSKKGKKGSRYIMIYISMTYKLIKCIESPKTLKY